MLLNVLVTVGTLSTDATTVYALIGEPWLVGAFRVTFAFRFCATAVGLVGAAGFLPVARPA